MKLTKVQTKINNSICDLIIDECFYKTNDSIPYDTWRKIRNEINTPNNESISRMQVRTLENLQNEIN